MWEWWVSFSLVRRKGQCLNIFQCKKKKFWVDFPEWQNTNTLLQYINTTVWLFCIIIIIIITLFLLLQDFEFSAVLPSPHDVFLDQFFDLMFLCVSCLCSLWQKLKSSMETSAPTATDKKECKSSGLDGSSFSELPKKPSPTTLTRGTSVSVCSFLIVRWKYSRRHDRLELWHNTCQSNLLKKKKNQLLFGAFKHQNLDLCL